MEVAKVCGSKRSIPSSMGQNSGRQCLRGQGSICPVGMVHSRMEFRVAFLLRTWTLISTFEKVEKIKHTHT